MAEVPWLLSRLARLSLPNTISMPSDEGSGTVCIGYLVDGIQKTVCRSMKAEASLHPSLDFPPIANKYTSYVLQEKIWLTTADLFSTRS